MERSLFRDTVSTSGCFVPVPHCVVYFLPFLFKEPFSIAVCELHAGRKEGIQYSGLWELIPTLDTAALFLNWQVTPLKKTQLKMDVHFVTKMFLIRNSVIVSA